MFECPHPCLCAAALQPSPRSPNRLPNAWRQNDDKQRVLDATDIVRLVGDHVALKAKGKEYVGLCPFHNDRNPSMYVVPAKQIFHCFVCGAGGGSIDFVMRLHGMAFIEALKFLADRAGIEMAPRPARGGTPGSDESHGGAEGVTKEDLLAANAFALEFFRTILRHPEHGALARAVVQQRRIADQMAEMFQLGASPDRWDGLLKMIESKRMDPLPFVAAGLLKKRETGGLYDALRNRLIFPILDQIGRPIAFGGRKINPEDEPKYLNSPETPLFNKSATLFALPQAFRSIQNERCAIVTEGYTDAIACHQAGFTNVVATLGTALTPRHASLLRRYCDKVVLLFDADEAGQNAADRALEVFFTEPVDVLVMQLPGGKDPDEVLKTEGGVDVFKRQFAAAVDMLDFRFGRKNAEMRARGALPGSAGFTRMVEEDLARLSELGLDRVSPLRRQAILSRYASMAGVGVEIINQTLRAGAGRRPFAQVAGVSEEPISGRVTASGPLEVALGCVLACPAIASIHAVQTREIAEAAAYDPDPSEGAIPTSSTHSARFAVARWIVHRLDSGSEPSLTALLAELDDAEARRVATALSMEARVRCQDEDAAVVEAFQEACSRLVSARTSSQVHALLTERTPGGPDLGGLQKMLELRRQGAALVTRPRPAAQTKK